MDIELHLPSKWGDRPPVTITMARKKKDFNPQRTTPGPLSPFWGRALRPTHPNGKNNPWSAQLRAMVYHGAPHSPHKSHWHGPHFTWPRFEKGTMDANMAAIAGIRRTGLGR